MAIVTANSSLQLGFYRGSSNGISVLIDSPSAGLALPFIADFTGNITRIALFTGSVVVYTFTPTFTASVVLMLLLLKYILVLILIRSRLLFTSTSTSTSTCTYP
jgi:hypothetical protein